MCNSFKIDVKRLCQNYLSYTQDSKYQLQGRGVMRGQYGHTGLGIPTELQSLLLAIPYQSETQRDDVKITSPTLSLKMVSIAYGIGEG